MSSDGFTAEVKRIIERLSVLDARRVVFGASRHQYKPNPRASESELSAFESEHGIQLPAPYRAFLTEIGNGGPGPYYGVFPIDPRSRWVARPFPHVSTFELAEEALEAPLDGTLTIADYGCGIEVVLVVHGEASGQVWIDARYESGITPAENAEKRPMRFDEWWLLHMRSHLERFEQVLAMMNDAVPHEEIHRALEPRTIQLDVDLTMASLMDINPNGSPKVPAKKPWGMQCGWVEEHYPAWLALRRG
ncbi:SMI1/KNR4 family protein [Hyalangium gracile]|uniref:SMI1/KNR4 family protein n=1 Tax=Hyalangium gracile TaxID=394092 RepID=UPI001CCE96A5|nr:SMI1/KNR4 family protein [Hyalangium gracile]